jgi:hypothetical protein
MVRPLVLIAIMFSSPPLLPSSKKERIYTHNLLIPRMLNQHISLPLRHAPDDLPLVTLVGRAPDVAADLVVVKDGLRWEKQGCGGGYEERRRRRRAERASKE